MLLAYEGLHLDLTPAGAIEMQLIPERDAAVITPTSSFDEQQVYQFIQQFTTLSTPEDPTSSVIDLSQVEHLTTTSLKALVNFNQQRKTDPVVLAALSPAVENVIKLAGYGDYFAVYPTVEEATKAVQARQALKLPGQIINKQYQIADQLGEGRLGTALKVMDLQTQRVAALKTLPLTLGVETIDRFASQVHLLLELDHPAIARIYDCDWSQDGNYTFIVEELLSGPTLHERLSNQYERLTEDEALDIALNLTVALEYAHSRGVIHGNLRPEDIFLTADGVKLSSFGLGRLEETRNLLEAPMLFLTASHLAPEQILGQPLDARTDLYALGIILYQLFTGRLPFEGSEHEILQAHLEQPPIPPRQLNPNLSHSIEHLILKLLAKNPSDRYGSAKQARRIASGLISSGGEGHLSGQHPLVGREHQLQRLRSCWVEVQAGCGQLALITGEPGI
ncbi:MAG: protein kinase, partial [Anaerolineales bacterium]|nr:protein kinase [Anaerolineales bacterium]